ncbi:MAG: CotH kinase family protein, partial [Bacteroides sp.]|nr:CotH kinase family protein [Bacteroides sp.]
LGSPPPFDMSANFWKRWERPVHIEFYTPDGEKGFKQDAGIAIFGGFLGRQLPQKAFTLYARNKYGDPDFDYPLFQSKPSNSYRRFLLRCSSNDYNRTFIRDAMMNSLVIGQMDVDYQASQPAMVYINGEFWGLYNIREKMNQFFPESNFDIDADQVEIIEGFDIPAHGDDSHYHHLIESVIDHDLAIPENYQYVKTQMDVVEFMNYYITEIYVCNHDWLHQNIKCWREQGKDGKWRWLLYDMDWGFNGQDPFGSDQAPDNTIQWVLNQEHVSILFQRLIMNDDFRTEFAQRFITHNMLTFAPERVHAIIDSMVQIIAPEMPRQIERWGAIPNMDYWAEQLDQLHQFAQDRQFHISSQIYETLMPEEKRELILEVSNEKAGWISVFDVPCPVPYFSNFWFRNIPLEIQAHAKPGWRFVRWEGYNSSTDRNIQIRLLDNTVLYAVFEPAELPSLTISEIHYNPSFDLQGDDEEFEFIELLNREEYRIDISGYQFTEGIEYTFPNGCNIDAGEYIIVAKTAQAYSDKTAPVFQFSDGSLNNAGEELTLSNDQGMVIDHVHFDDRSPWPEEPDGEGPSLELKDPSLDNNLASSWKRSDGTGGTPGTGSITGIDDLKQITEEQFKFSIHPNPISHTTRISYSLSEESRTTVRILNSSGQEVGILESALLKPGIYEHSWKPGSLPPGIYFVHIISGKYKHTKKAIYLKRE